MKTQQTVPTFESVWAAMQESNRFLTERQAETERFLNEKFAEVAQLQKETERKAEESRADYDRRMQKMEETIGSWANNHGSFAEEYFFNSFEKGQKNFFGKKFDTIRKGVQSTWKNVDGEYDIVLYNADSIAIIEVKFKAHENDIKKVLKKAETFKILYPYYKDFKIYLGLASMSFYSELELACIDKGIAVIKQVGDMVVIIDEGLKAY
jgi:hypothetical protein